MQTKDFYINLSSQDEKVSYGYHDPWRFTPMFAKMMNMYTDIWEVGISQIFLDCDYQRFYTGGSRKVTMRYKEYEDDFGTPTSIELPIGNYHSLRSVVDGLNAIVPNKNAHYRYANAYSISYDDEEKIVTVKARDCVSVSFPGCLNEMMGFDKFTCFTGEMKSTRPISNYNHQPIISVNADIVDNVIFGSNFRKSLLVIPLNKDWSTEPLAVKFDSPQYHPLCNLSFDRICIHIEQISGYEVAPLQGRCEMQLHFRKRCQ